MRWFSSLLFSVLVGGCAGARIAAPTRARAPTLQPITEPLAEDSTAFDEILTVRSTQRLAELKSLGGECAAYGSVLESSLLERRVTVRTYMWRVDGRLVSGEARRDGNIVVARHIDRLNVGVRSVEDVIRTLEHEAAHVTFGIVNGPNASDDLASSLVRACRS